MRGEIREQDLHRLFLSIREKAGGSGLVGEIAHFLAHPSLRTKGVAWHEVRDMFVFLKFRVPLSRRSIITTDFPASMPNALRANLRRMRQPTLKRETGFSRSKAEKVLETMLARAIPTPGGVKLGPLSEAEARVLLCVSSHAKAGPLFDDSELFEDFCRPLQKQGILRSTEKPALKKAKPAITLFALTAMHNAEIDLGDGSTAKLQITPDIRGRLAIFAIAEVLKDHGAGAQSMATWLFKTGLSVEDYCEPGVPPPTRAPFVGDFEMTPQLKLVRLS